MAQSSSRHRPGSLELEASALGRHMPFNMIAEQCLLGAIIEDPNIMEQLVGMLSADDFYSQEHSDIFTAMQALFLESHQINVVTLIDRLVVAGVYEDQAKGTDYLVNLAQSVPSATNAKEYAVIIKNNSILRQIIEACGDISDMAYAEQNGADEVLDVAQNRIFSIVQGRETKGFDTIRELLIQNMDHLNQLQKHPEDFAGLKVGFEGLDRILAGIGKSDFVLVGARPGMGKTSFALNLATNVAQSTKKTVCIFSLEMSSSELVNRMLSSEGLVDSYHIRTGQLTPEDWDSLAIASGHLSECNILIDDTAGQSVMGMKAKLRRVKNLGLVVIDYLGLMQNDRKTDNRVQEVADITRGLKLMAKELEVPIICCAQLSRGPENRDKNKRPQLADLRDSGSIEQDADVVMFLYRDDYYNKPENPETNLSIAEVIVAKNRHGQTDTVRMGWNASYTRFRSIADESKGIASH